MNRNEICIRKLDKVYVVPGSGTGGELAQAIAVEMLRMGYDPSQELLDVLATQSEDELKVIHGEVLPVLANSRGADVSWNPMYPNFPKQVVEATKLELLVNAYRHYWSGGKWKPAYTRAPRPVEFDDGQKIIGLGLATEDEYLGVLGTILASNDSVSEEDRAIATWMLYNELEAEIPDEVPHKELSAIVAAALIERGSNMAHLYIDTTTDFLRTAVALSGGDVSLAKNTKFKSLPRSMRRELVNLVEGVIREEDVARHQEKWVRLFHSLHVGEYKWAEKTNAIAEKVRSGQTLETTNSKIESAIKGGDIMSASQILKNRPGDLARRVMHLLREAKTDDDTNTILEAFADAAPSVSTRVLTQLRGAIKTVESGAKQTIVLPKGQGNKAQKIDVKNSYVPAMDEITDTINATLADRFMKLEPLGKVYVDESLKGCPLPTAQRSASKALKQCARGTRFPIGNGNTLRFFVHWIGQDIDLHATMHDENFQMVETVGWTRLRSNTMQTYHSGDITYAPEPDGACEFIDVTIDGALAKARYIMMQLIVYSGPNFADHKACSAGWMTRSKVNSNEIFDPKTVQNKIDITATSRNGMPVMFDLKTREAIWLDLSGDARSGWRGRTAVSNRAQTEDIVRMYAESPDRKMTLHELFTLHAMSRGDVVDDRSEADVVFSVDEGVTPFDINAINGEYLS